VKQQLPLSPLGTRVAEPSGVRGCHSKATDPARKEPTPMAASLGQSKVAATPLPPREAAGLVEVPARAVQAAVTC
jgi:hypothetical protein